MKKKILAVFLSLCMAMSLLPVTALATGDEETETQTPTESSIATEKALKEAIAAARPGDTVTLDGNIDITAPVVIDKQITLDLDGKKIFASSPIWNEKDNDWSLISVREKGDLTIKGNGTLKARENDSYAVDVMDGGSCTIQNGTFVGNVHAVYVLQGTLVVNGGTFSVQQKYQDEAKAYEFVLNCYDENYQNGSSSITVNGGKFVNFNPANCKAEGDGTSFMSSDCTSSKDPKEDETTYWTVTKKETISVEKPENATGTTVDATVGGVAIPSGTGSGDITTEGQTLTLDATVTDGSDTVTTSNVTVGGTALNAIADAGNVANVAIKTNVGTLTVSKAALEKIVESAEKAANNGITPDVTLSIEKVDTTDADNGVTYNVNATVAVGGTTKEVFTEASADSNATIQVSVPAPTGVTDDVHVYYLGPNGAEEVSGAKVEGTNVSWTVEHFSTYYVTAEEQEASVTVTKDGATTTTPYDTLADALNAVKDSGGTITLLKDAALENANYTIKGDVTITGTGTITATPAVPASDDASTHAFTITKDGSLTLDGVDLAISSNATTGKTYGFDVQYGGKLTLDNSDVTLSGLTNATISSKATDAGDAEPGVYTLTNSTITATNIRGNFSNGGTWTIGTGSKVTIDGCASHGFSASAITVENGATVDIKNVAYRGISINDANGKLEIQAGGVVNVTNAGTADSDTYDAVYLHENASNGLIVQEGATLNVTAGKDGNDRIELSTAAASKSELDGTIIGTVDLPENASHWVVTYKDNGKNWKVELVAKDSATITLPEIPDQGYNHFQGWNDGTTTYAGGAQVTISKDTIFTAVWSYIPPANPNYRIDILAAEGGTVTADPAAAKAGATVTLTATPDEGYALGSLTVTDRFGDAVKVTENADGTYTFTMPNGQVTVKATFVETQEPAPAEPFPDVDENDWFYDEVVYVYENGLMNGVENNRFAPNTATNRAMLATILYRLAGQPDVSGDLPFTDVAAGTWYTDAVLWAAQNGIVNGLGENTFAPMNTLTREQLVTMLYRYAEAAGYDVSAAADLSGYPDAGKVQTYAQKAMSWAVAEGIVEGMDGNLNPAGSATRAQIATILMRFCEGVAK